MREAKLGDDVFWFYGCDRKQPMAAKVAKVSPGGSVVLAVLHPLEGWLMRSCHHIDDPWHQEFPAASLRDGGWDFTEPCDNPLLEVVRRLYVEHGDNVDEIFKRVRSKGVSRSQVEEMLVEVA